MYQGHQQFLANNLWFRRDRGVGMLKGFCLVTSTHIHGSSTHRSRIDLSTSRHIQSTWVTTWPCPEVNFSHGTFNAIRYDPTRLDEKNAMVTKLSLPSSIKLIKNTYKIIIWTWWPLDSKPLISSHLCQKNILLSASQGLSDVYFGFVLRHLSRYWWFSLEMPMLSSGFFSFSNFQLPYFSP